MTNDQRLAVMYGQLALTYIARGDGANAAILAARAAHYAGRYAATVEYQRRGGMDRLLWAILKSWKH